MHKELYIVIVTWNAQNFIRDCLNSIYKQKTVNFGVIVVDNNSADETRNIINNEFSQVMLVKNSRNVGFSAANNQGISKAINLGSKYIVLLNQDTEVADNFVMAGLKYLQENQAIGLASPIVYFADKKKIWFAGSKIYHGKEILLHPTTKLGEHINKKEILTTNDLNNPVDWIPGCAMFIEKKVIEKIGQLDEKFFMYGEDIDFSLRAQMAGFKLGMISTTFIIHKERLEKKLEFNRALWKKTFLMVRARYLNMNRYFSSKEKCYYLIKLLYTPCFQLTYAVKRFFS